MRGRRVPDVAGGRSEPESERTVFKQISESTLFIVRYTLMGLGVALLVVVFSGNRHVLVPTAPGASFAEAVARAAPTVVSVHTASAREQPANPLLDDPLFQRFFRIPVPRQPETETSLGSGVIVGRDGTILTNYHVVRDADRIQTVLHDGRIAEANVIGSDPDTDIAVLKISYGDLPAITIGDSNSARIGDVVLAIGNPVGVGQTVTQGIISGTGRNRVGINTFENFIQTDAAINPGNSGGALVNTKGELIGINAAILGYEGIGFAIPTSIAVDVMQQLVRHGRVQRGWIGVDARDLSANLRAELKADTNGGIAVLAVMPAGPAAAAGIMPGDVLSMIGERRVHDSQEAVEAISKHRPGTVVRISGTRMGQPIEFETAVVARPSYSSR